MLTLVVPIGGRIFFEKPNDIYPIILTHILGKPILHYALKGLSQIPGEKKFVFISPREFENKYKLSNILKLLLDSPFKVHLLDQSTRGMPCSLLLAADLIDPDSPVLVAGCDQFVDWELGKELDSFQKKGIDSGIFCFPSIHPKWSYAKLNSNNNVLEVREKQPISSNALASLHYFKQGALMFDCIKKMIKRAETVEGLYFLSPALNELILENKIVEAVQIDNQKYFKFYDYNQVEAFSKYLEEKRKNNENKIRKLTEAYIDRFNQGDLNGLATLFTEDFVLEDPFIKKITGKEPVLQFLEKIFRDHPQRSFRPRRISVSNTNQSFIEFDLQLGGKTFSGIDIIEWDNGEMKILRAYLNEIQ